MRNIEIKAKVRDIESLIAKAKTLSKSEGTIIKQNDSFFVVPRGRLKLRKFEVRILRLFILCYHRELTIIRCVLPNGY